MESEKIQRLDVWNWNQKIHELNVCDQKNKFKDWMYGLEK
jgi:hypothetical protein